MIIQKLQHFDFLSPPFLFDGFSMDICISITELMVPIICCFLSDVPVPSACVILVCLFMLQHFGTRKVGFLFAPIVVIWLLFISGVGIYNIFHWDHKIMYAISPAYMYSFVKNIDKRSWKSLGSILLCVAGKLAWNKVASCFPL